MMMYTDASNGRNMAKDPAVVIFLGSYFMYYSVGSSCSGIDGWKIGIAKSIELSN